MSVNRVVLVGRLVADPEVKYTAAGVAVAQLRIAVSRFTKKEDGSGYESDFFNCVAWRKTAEFVKEYLHKGRLISVDGRLQQRSWVDQNSGQNRSVVEIVAEHVEGLDRKQEEETPAAQRQEAQRPPQAQRPSAPPPPEEEYDQEADPFADD